MLGPGTPLVYSGGGSGGSAAALKKVTDEINSLNFNSISPLQKQLKTAVNKLKKIVENNINNLNNADKKKLAAEVSKKVRSMIGSYTDYYYYVNNKKVYGGLVFNQTTGKLRAFKYIVCSQYTSLIYYIMGLTQHLTPKGTKMWTSGNNAWFYLPQIYSYADGFKGSTLPDEWPGVTNLAYNRSILKPMTDANNQQITGTKIAQWLNNPTKYKAQLDSLIGTTFMARHQKANPNNRPYQVYEHTGIITGYKIVNGKAVLQINDSTIKKWGNNPDDHGIGKRLYSVKDITDGWKTFHIYKNNFER